MECVTVGPILQRPITPAQRLATVLNFLIFAVEESQHRRGNHLSVMLEVSLLLTLLCLLLIRNATTLLPHFSRRSRVSVILVPSRGYGRGEIESQVRGSVINSPCEASHARDYKHCTRFRMTRMTCDDSNKWRTYICFRTMDSSKPRWP